MASNVHVLAASRDTALDTIFNAVGTSGLLRIYDGTQPATVATALGAQVKLAELPLSATGFTASSGGTKTANAITSATILATSTATWATLTDSAGNRKVDFSVGTSGADLNFNSVAFSSGATCAVSSLSGTFAA